MSKIPIDPQQDVPAFAYGVGQSKQGDIKSVTVTSIATADDNYSVAEPSSPTHPQYPYNKAEQTLSGHLFEVDDTPGAERLLRMHKSGTFEEIHPDGTKVYKIFGDDFYIVLDDHTLTVGGNLNITVQGNANMLVKGNMKTKVDGDYNLTVNGNMTTRVAGTTKLFSKGSLKLETASEFNVRSNGATRVQSQNQMTFKAATTINTRSGGNTYIDGANVRLNDPGQQ